MLANDITQILCDFYDYDRDLMETYKKIKHVISGVRQEAIGATLRDIMKLAKEYDLYDEDIEDYAKSKGISLSDTITKE